uniref:Uncharacterized protein n=1 Tax=Solanum tuberosum TaxID=4113 RepID=M1AFH1_SOLTU
MIENPFRPSTHQLIEHYPICTQHIGLKLREKTTKNFCIYTLPGNKESRSLAKDKRWVPV